MDTVSEKNFSVGGIEIPWLTTFESAEKALSTLRIYSHASMGWLYKRYACEAVLGIPATECNISSPQHHKPVLRVHYELAPLKYSFFERTHTPYMRKMKKLFGKPDKIFCHYRPYGLTRKNLYSAVVYSADWILDDICITLSVYGGNRESESGTARAGLFAHWTNDLKAAQPFIEKNKALQTAIQNAARQSIPQIFTLWYHQRAFKKNMADDDNPDTTDNNTQDRSAQVALYKNQMLLTPVAVNERLTSNQIALYPDVSGHRLILCNKWDAVLLEAGTSVKFINVLPARGDGHYMLITDDLTISDDRNSNTLIELKNIIEQTCGITVEQSEGYDD